jgi:hypothetical protein
VAKTRLRKTATRFLFSDGLGISVILQQLFEAARIVIQKVPSDRIVLRILVRNLGHA